MTKFGKKRKILVMCGKPVFFKQTPSNQIAKGNLVALIPGNRQQATGNRQQATGNRQQATGNRQQAIIHTFKIYMSTI